ncbi:protein toll-like isoform X2 [Montipora capricornis]|uniref:protein toll-like isoform X2 n=1 Tax=Montipora capricornis TaxID=246305 RepID=UPI0035F1BE68
MQRSYFYHIFLGYVFLSFEAPHLRSSAVVVSGKKQGFQQYPTSVNQCLQKCSAAIDARKSMIEITEMSSLKSCSEKCLGKGMPGSLGTHQIKQSFKRIKRECIECPSCTNFGNPTDSTGVVITLHQLPKTERCYANVTWDALDSQSERGYYIYYSLQNFGLSITSINCTELRKGVNHYIIDNSSHGLTDSATVKVIITPLPNATTHNLTLYSRLKRVPQNCSQEGDSSPTPVSTLDSSPTSVSTLDHDTTIVIAVTVAASAIAIIGFSLLWYYRRKKRSTEGEKYISGFSQEPLLFEYDAFIIYSSKDEEWVKGTLLPTLEGKHGLKCCIHFRDFTPGMLYRQNMVNSVYASKKTVAVVSKNFFSSGFCESEFEYALRRLTERRDDSLIVIKLDDVDTRKLPLELKQRSYIDCPKSIEKETWETKLVNSLTVQG